MSKYIKNLRHALQIIPLLLFLGLAKLLPFNSRVNLGGNFFYFAIRLSPKLQKRIKTNLKIAFPHMVEKQQTKFVTEFSKLAGRTLTELIFNKQYQLRTHCFSYQRNELEPIREAKSLKRPIIIASGHFGPWEAIRAVLKTNGLTAGAIYKQNTNIFYEPIHLKAIKAGGEPIFPIGLKGTKNMISFLKSGGITAVMIDQAVTDGMPLPFLGRNAKTTTSIARLALKLNALVVPSYAIRDPSDNTVKIIFEKPIANTSIEDMTLKLNSSLETQLKLNPTQWYWLHRRWKE